MEQQQLVITPEVQAQEAAALEGYFRNRGLLQAQCIEHLKADLLAKTAELEDVKKEAAEQLAALQAQLNAIIAMMPPVRSAETVIEEPAE
ncbi:UNVERIFIED_ORG: hypothetical protein LHK14_18070 [Roseateles sp. XES5]|nr:hypothetical protein [Roseateles sp. XES5]